jgi:hypothetical protein
VDVCLLWVLCVVNKMSLWRADYSSIGVLSTVVRRYVWSRNLMNEEALAQWVLLCQKQTNLSKLLILADKRTVSSSVFQKILSRNKALSKSPWEYVHRNYESNQKDATM